MSRTLSYPLVKTILILLGVALLIYLVLAVVRLPAGMGEYDFRAYWSASYLLGNGRNFTDDTLLRQVQVEQTAFEESYVMKTWNLPWVLVWLLPYTLVSFTAAARLWFFTNLGLLQVSVMAAWRVATAVAPVKNRWGWAVALATAVLFPSTLVALLYGQTNIAVLAGIVGFLYFYRRRQDGLAGVALALTTLKPHLIYLVYPLILVELWQARRWRPLIAATATVLLSIVVLFTLRPGFLPEYLGSNSDGQLFGWETPTLATWLSLTLGWTWLRLMGVGLAPLAALLWWRGHGRFPFTIAIQIAIMLSLITAPFGWSYDFVLLLLPLTQVWAWLLSGKQRGETAVVILILIALFGLMYWQRIASPNELTFLWIPIAITAVYAFVARQRGNLT